MIRAKPDDVNLLTRLIDMRDSAELAGVRGAFSLTPFQGGQALLVGPSRVGSAQVATFEMSRLEDLGVFRVISRTARGGLSFDLVDDVRDLLEEMRVSLGQPSRMGELEASLARVTAEKDQAVAARNDLERKLSAAADDRAARRRAAAMRIGRRVRRCALVVLAFLYFVINVAVYAVTANTVVTFGVVLALGLVAAFAWLSHVDGFWLAARAETLATDRVRRWLDSLDR